RLCQCAQALPVELPDVVGTLPEGLDGRVARRVVARPQARAGAEVGEARGGRDAGAGQRDGRARRPQRGGQPFQPLLLLAGHSAAACQAALYAGRRMTLAHTRHAAADYPFSLELRARFFETDAMGVVHHASYLGYLETARVEYMRSIGHPYQRVR